MFHRHDWRERGRRFTKPAPPTTKVEGCPIDFAYDVFFGFTTVELKCAGCGELLFNRTPGDQTAYDPQRETR